MLTNEDKDCIKELAKEACCGSGEICQEFAQDAETAKNLAQQSAAQATIDAMTASVAASNALTSEQNALTSEQNALTSEQNAATSEQNALTSEQNALTSEQNALTSEQNALTSEQNAFTSEQNAQLAETNAVNAAATINSQVDFTGAANGDILLHNGTLFEPVNLVTALESLSLDVRIALGIEPAFVMRVNTATTGTGTVSGTNQMQLTGAVGTYIVEAYQGNTLIANLGTFTGAQTLTLPSAGIYDLRIIPTGATPFNRIAFGNGGDRNKVLGIRYWGQAVQWSSFNASLPNGCNNNAFLPVGAIPNGGAVTSFSSCFQFKPTPIYPIRVV
jgi:hypothetical protein